MNGHENPHHGDDVKSIHGKRYLHYFCEQLKSPLDKCTLHIMDVRFHGDSAPKPSVDFIDDIFKDESWNVAILHTAKGTKG